VVSFRVDPYKTNGWTPNPKWGYNVYGDGFPWTGIGDYRTAKAGYTFPNYQEGGLVGKIEINGSPFYVGNECSLPAETGKLYLTCNDDMYGQYGQGYADNQGTLVQVTSIPTSTPTPPPPGDTHFISKYSFNPYGINSRLTYKERREVSDFLLSG
jgi:hypothetical protein